MGRRALVLAIAFALAAYLARLACEPPDHGYTRYAAIAYEMVRSGDWIAPRLDAQLYVDKPPLVVWLIAVPMALAGSPASLAQHAPNLVALALSVLFLRRLGARLFGRADAGWIAAGLYVSMLLPSAMLRDKRIDPLFAALLLGALDALLAALAAVATPRARRARWLAAAGWLAAAVLAKGPLALVFFALVALAFAAWSGRLAALATRDVALAALLFLALVAAWPLALARDVGFGAWSARFSERRMMTRFAGPLHYVATLPLRVAPWTLLLPAFALGWRAWLRGAAGAALRFPAAWFAVLFVALHVTAAKHARYLLPALPAAALLLVALWVAAPAGAPAELDARVRRLRDGAIAALLALGALAGAAAIVAPLASPAARAVWPALAAGGALLAWISGAALRALRGGGDATAIAARAVVAALLVQAGVDVLRAGHFRTHDEFGRARAALAAASPTAPLITLGVDGDARNALLLASGRPAAEGRHLEDALRFARGGGGLVVAPAERIAALRAEPGLAVGDAVPLRLARRALAVARLGPSP